jgi:hypothetical protein
MYILQYVYRVGGLGVIVPDVSHMFAVSGGKFSRSLSDICLLACFDHICHFLLSLVWCVLFLL